MAGPGPATASLPLALDPGADGPNAFLRRLAGLVKHSLNTHNGRASVQRWPWPTGQREGTVRLGLAWLAARGPICVRRRRETSATDAWWWSARSGIPDSFLAEARRWPRRPSTELIRVASRHGDAADQPRYCRSSLRLDVAYGEQGRTDEETREYQAALRINPDYADAHYNLGVIYGQRGAPMRRCGSIRRRC